MGCVRGLLFGLSLAAFAAPGLAAPLALYGHLPSIEAADLSPSGDQVAVVVTNGEERRILVKDLVHDRVTFVGGFGTAKVRDMLWAGEDHIIVVNSETGRPVAFDLMADWAEWRFASDLDLKSKKLLPLMHEEEMRNIVGLPMVRTVGGRPVVFVLGTHFVNDLGVVSLYRVDLERGDASLLLVGHSDTDGFLVDADGRPIAEELFNPSSGHWSLHMNAGQAWAEAMTTDSLLASPDVMGLGRDGRSVLVAADWKEGDGWREVTAAQAGPLIGAAPGQTPIHEASTGRLIGHAALVGDEDRYTFFDPADERLWKAVTAAFPGARVSLVAWAANRSRVLVRVDSPTEGPAFAVVDVASHHASWLGGEYEGLTEADVSPVTPLSYKAADGLQLSGYLTLPRGREAKALPLIVFPHGGPAARDTPGFDWWAQGMAARGYAVLQVNFRGSDGFGWDFLKAGFGEWGRKMQSDLSDGVRYLAARGIIDPKRVCIVGASYGGYAALAGATLDPGVYRCAVSFGGISDLKRFVGYAKGRGGRSSQRYWTRFMGANDPNDPVLARYSPALQAQNATAPVLLIHGKDDTVVPLDQSREMADALRRAGKPVELVVQDNADHWLSLGKTRLEMLQATMAFVEKNNPPD